MCDCSDEKQNSNPLPNPVSVPIKVIALIFSKTCLTKIFSAWVFIKESEISENEISKIQLTLAKNLNIESEKMNISISESEKILFENFFEILNQ